MSPLITLSTKTQVFDVITQAVGVDAPELNNIHDNYQKDIGSFAEMGLGKAFHHTLKVVNAAHNLLC